MNTEIDYNLDISWRVELNDGSILFDKQESPSSWLNLKHYIHSNLDKNIVAMQVFKTKNNPPGSEFIGISVPKSNAKGYFFSKRLSSVIGGQSSEDIGFGFMQGDLVSITWLEPKSFLPIQSEIRSKERCEQGLIVNNT